MTIDQPGKTQSRFALAKAKLEAAEAEYLEARSLLDSKWAIYRKKLDAYCKLVQSGARGK